MKKTLLLGTALVLGVAGFSQATAKKAINPKYLQRKEAASSFAAEPKPSTSTGIKVNAKLSHPASTLSGCSNAQYLTSSWNCFGTGGGLNTSTQNCLSYNGSLNSVIWTQRGSVNWPLITTSGFMQATIVNVNTLAKDSVIIYADGHHARYPSGTFLNPSENTSVQGALAVGFGEVTDGTNWTGTAYTAKPLWSKSAVNHTAPTSDSLYTPSAGGLFGTNCSGSGYALSPNADVQALPDGKTVMSIGALLNQTYASLTNGSPITKGLIVKGVLDATGKVVNWTVDSSLAPNVYVAPLGYMLTSPRLAFGPDGLHGYAVFTGRLATAYGNLSDSAFTPIVYQTTDGGTTWTQKLAGFDWMCKHPEVAKNVGELTGKTNNFTISESNGVDLVVDANNVLHYVCTVDQPYHPNGGDSLNFSYNFDYDYVNYHPIIWDLMTDGTDWKTMMVDSLITSLCGSASTDSTSTHSAMGGSQILGVGGHITVSRSADGTKVFYGWADSDPNVTGTVYNTNPDILMKAYDVNTNRMTPTKNITGLGSCFYPFLSDISYKDGSGNWVVPAVYTTGHTILSSSSGFNIYDASSSADYYYTNCGTFAPSEFTGYGNVFTSPAGTTCTALGIKSNNNAFASAISNYPNPFNNTTTISVTLSENKAVDVKVYNAIGTLVFSKKINGNVGENAVTFDGGALSSGVYYYTVTAGNEQATKKMVIQK